jgi:glycosyltransferase involved in cell wall biosynthesis
MATYNGGKYIYAQLESIVKQLSKNDEVVISDDSSADDTVDIINNFKDKRIQLYENNHFHSPILNFENALKKASGNIIFLSDQDDIWLDNKVKIMAKLLLSYDLVISDCILVDENEAVLNDSFFKLRGSGPGIIHNLIRNSFLGCCMAFNSNLLIKALPFPRGTPMHDMWIGMIGEVFGKTYFCKEKLVKYRRHCENVSPEIGKSKFSIIEKCKLRSTLLYNMIKRYVKTNL